MKQQPSNCNYYMLKVLTFDATYVRCESRITKQKHDKELLVHVAVGIWDIYTVVGIID
jgi:hypothetical protein